MLTRKFYSVLREWKRTKKRECLLVNGARQVGKTFIIEQFGKNEYQSYVYVNFLRNPEYRAIFEGSLEPTEIYKRMTLYVSEISLVPGDTLIFLDEIQACKKARTALKFLAIDERYDIVASGSLLGVHYHGEDKTPQEELSIPVGYERELTMHSLDFEEFCWAMGVGEGAFPILRDYFVRREKPDDAISKRYQQLLREFMVVGGMPEVVNSFQATSNYQEAYDNQEKILRAYEDDIQKYAPNADKPKIKAIYQSMPRQLSREYTKFQYGKVERGGSARKFGNAIDWLIDAGMIARVTNVSLPQLPLVAYEKPEEFKVYVTDIGLATHLFGFETQVALARGTLTGPAKGGIFENLVFDLLHKRDVKTFYFKRGNNSQEIEFLIEREGGAIPIEVKAKNGATKSLNAFIEEFQPATAYKMIDGNLAAVDQRVILPQYMAMFV